MKMKEKKDNQKAQISPALVAKAKAGDQNAFSELYQQTSTALYRSIRSMVHDDDTAWDIQQETYLKAFQSLNKLEHNEAFLPWLRRISVNVTATEMSKRLPTTFTDLGDEDEEYEPDQADLSIDSQPELALDQKETSRLVREILADLPEQQHLIVGMRYYEDLSVKEISDLLHLAPTTVKTQLARGRKHVEASVRALEKQGIKLYGLSPIAFLVALMRRAEPTELARQTAIQSTVTKAAAGAAGAAASNATVVTAYTAKQMLRGTIGKILIGALSVAVIGGGVWAGAKLLGRSQPAPYQPTETRESVRLAGSTENPYAASDESLSDWTEPTTQTEPTEPVSMSSGVCGDNLTWKLEKDSSGNEVLVLAGGGEMYDYGKDENRAPWYAHRDHIQYVQFPVEDITIGSYAFCDCTQLAYVYNYADVSVSAIGRGAFQGCSSLEYFYVPKGCTEIGADAFSGCTAMTYFIYDENLSAIGANALAQCSALESVLLPDGLTEAGASLFSGCTALREVWIMNEACTLGANLGDPSRVTIHGFADSTAERYARENGYSFEPIVVMDKNEMVELMKQTWAENEAYMLAHPDAEQSPLNCDVQINDATWVGSRYLVNVVRANNVTVPAEEMAQMLKQAGQSGELILNGVEYRYTASLDQAHEWAQWDGFGEENKYGWITKKTEATDEYNYVYGIYQEGDLFYFDAMIPTGESNSALDEFTELGWIWLDGDTKMGAISEGFTLREDFPYGIATSQRKFCELHLDENGEYQVDWLSAGR